jgi:hypothetical protein
MTPTHLCIFVIISPLKSTWPFIWTNENPLYLKMICIKFDWNWPARSGEDFFKNFQCIFTLLLLPLGKGVPLHLNNLEFPPLKDDLCQVWSKLTQWFWRRIRKCKSLQTDGQWAIRNAHLSFQLRWAKNKSQPPQCVKQGSPEKRCNKSEDNMRKKKNISPS